MVEGGVERGELFLRDERKDGSPQEGQVFRAVGFAAHAAVFTPAGGITPPVVFVFHRPMLATNPRQSGMANLTFSDAEDEVPGFLFGLAAVLGLMVAGEARELPGSGEEACVQIKGDDAQLAVLDAAVGAFGGRDPGGGKMI